VRVPFLNRGGKASIYNTFTQSFYYDAQRTTGEVRFPENNGDTVGGSEYGVVVRTDPSVTEVWYHIDDNSASNDDSASRASKTATAAALSPSRTRIATAPATRTRPTPILNENGVWDAASAPPG
jgi:hypothetical protein